MANQIARNFEFEQDEEKAVAAIATHIQRFWAPLMREKIFAYLREDGSGLAPRARQALERLMENEPA
ncbi:MAG: formate dehydrogenase subunit delta [Spongiibacteraceae bacterium]|nr:formate dehydrogenase subunit delta [Spongiibacteraceae bacterium]